MGKTALAMKIAARCNTEIISADSRQIFRELTIGTAKPSVDELKRIPHHFIDSHSISDQYDAAQYGTEALGKINSLFKTHEVVVMCGGSGLYIRAALDGFDDIPPVPDQTRQFIQNQYNALGIEWLQAELKRLDPEQLGRIDVQNPARLMRALEVRMATGASISSFQRNAKIRHPFKVIKIGLACEREELYRRIDQRMDEMIEAGLFTEAEALFEHRHHQALQTVGYQEIFGCMQGAYDKDEAIRLLKRNSRRYAKRQLTWFRKDKEVTWFDISDLESISKKIEELVA